MSDSKWDRVPPPGHVWVCLACGRIGRGKRSAMGDTSCVIWARLAAESDVTMAGGRATRVERLAEPDE